MRLLAFRPSTLYLLRGGALTWLVCVCFACPPHAGAENTRPLPDARVTLTFDKARPLVGESVVLRYQLDNIGAKPFTLAGTRRSYRLTAWYSDGSRAPTPRSGVFYGDDFFGIGPLQPGASRMRYIPLMRRCLMDRPGTYRIRLEQALEGNTWDMVWNAGQGGGRKLPSPQPIGLAETTLTLAAPNTAQARQALERMSVLPPGDEPAREEVPATPHADYSILHHPAYLPFLRERALTGHAEALEGIASIDTPAATQALMDVYGRGRLDWQGQSALYRRLPPFDVFYGGTRAWGRVTTPTRAAWRTRFGPVLRACALHTLAARSRLAARAPLAASAQNEQISFAASLLSKVGTPADFPTVLAALNEYYNTYNDTYNKTTSGAFVALPDVSSQPPTPDSPPQVSLTPDSAARGALIAAAQALARRGASPPADPQTTGEKMLFLDLIAGRHSYRPDGWAERYAVLLEDPRGDIRLLALQNLPDAPPPVLARAVRIRLPDWLKPDTLPQWRDAALYAAARVSDKEAGPQILDTLAHDMSRDTLQAAFAAASALGLRAQALESVVSRVDTSPTPLTPQDWDSPPQQMLSLAMDLMSGLVANTAGAGMDTNLTPSDRIALRAHWLAFLRVHREEINRRPRFDPMHSILTPDLFPSPYFTFHLRGGKLWPQ